MTVRRIVQPGLAGRSGSMPLQSGLARKRRDTASASASRRVHAGVADRAPHMTVPGRAPCGPPPTPCLKRPHVLAATACLRRHALAYPPRKRRSTSAALLPTLTPPAPASHRPPAAGPRPRHGGVLPRGAAPLRRLRALRRWGAAAVGAAGLRQLRTRRGPRHPLGPAGVRGVVGDGSEGIRAGLLLCSQRPYSHASPHFQPWSGPPKETHWPPTHVQPPPIFFKFKPRREP
jgi:hypothetical protein